MSDDDIIRLEERLAHLERHIEQQDLEIYRQSEVLKRLAGESERLRQRLEDVAEAKDLPGNERPPHY